VKELPLYRLTINEDDEDTGVSMVALVDTPAIEKTWMMFNAAKQNFKTDSERKIISGALMIPNLPIYRIEPNGKEYRVVFDKQTIENIAMKFMNKSNMSSANIMHDGIAVKDVFMFESIIIDKSRGTVIEGFKDLIDGSWFGSWKVNNEDIWQQVKAGTYKGFSVEGNFKQTLIDTIDDEVMKALAQIVLN
jgi:hypothetical protein